MHSWTADTDHSELSFSVKHLMLVNTTGKFEDFKVEINCDEEDIASTQFHLKARPDSINTLHKIRDERLRDEDFLDVNNYPKMSFRSTQLRPLGGENEFELSGNLRLKNVTKAIALKAVYAGKAIDSYSGEPKTGWQISGEIDRRDWNINFNLPFEGEGVAVGNKISIKAELECVLKK